MGFVRKLLCCGCACSKPRPQFKQHVQRVFPNAGAVSEAASSQPRNLSELVHYALSYPEQLTNIGRYLHKIISRDLKVGDRNAVRVGMATLNALIDACHSDTTQLGFYDSWIIKSTLLLFEHSDVHLRILASETFRKLVHYQDEWSEYRKLDVFFDHLVALCVYEHEDESTQNAARIAGIQSMSKMVLFTEPQNTLDHISEIVPAIFDNIRVDPSAEDRKADKEPMSGSFHQQHGDDVNSSPETLARACLRNIGTLANLNFIELILAPIFKYLDDRLWKPPEFALTCILIIADSSQLDHGYGMCYLILRHLDNVNIPSKDKSKHLAVQTRIVQVMAELVLVTRLDLGPWGGLIDFLMQQIEKAVDSGSDELRDAVINCVASYCVRLPNSHDVIDLLGIIVEQLPQERSDLPKTRALLRCALHAAALRRPSSDLSSASDHMLSTLMNACLPDSENDITAHSDVFVAVHDVLVNLAVPFTGRQRTIGGRVESGQEGRTRRFGEPSTLAALAASKVDNFIIRLWTGSRTDDVIMMGSKNTNARSVDAYLSERHHRWIHLSIHSHLQEHACPSPEHFRSYFRSMLVHLHLRPHRTLLASVPMLLSWLDTYPLPPASGDPLSCAQLKASRVAVLISAYLLGIARVLAALDSRRASQTIDELGTSALERAVKLSPEIRLVVDPESALCVEETTSVKHKHGVKGRDGVIKGGHVDNGCLLDRLALIHALSRVSFPGMDAQAVRETLSTPFDASRGGMESPRRQSVSVAPPVVVERSYSELEPSRSRSSLPSMPSNAQDGSKHKLKTNDSDGNQESDALANSNSVTINVEASDVQLKFGSDSDSESGSLERRTSLSAIEESNAAPVHSSVSFNELTTTFLREHDQRMNWLSEIAGSGDDRVDSDSVLSDLMGSSTVDARLQDTYSSSADVPSSSQQVSDSRYRSPGAVPYERQLSRSSVLHLPDNPGPILSAQQMLSGLESSHSGEHMPDSRHEKEATVESSVPASALKRSRRRRLSEDQGNQDVSVFSLNYPALSGLRDHSEDVRDRTSSI